MLTSCVLRKPLMYEFIRPAAAMGTPEKLVRFELAWACVREFRKIIYMMP